MTTEERISKLENELSMTLLRLRQLEARNEIVTDLDSARVKAIQERVAGAFGYTRDQILSKARPAHLVMVRHLICYLCYRFTKLDHGRLSEMMGRERSAFTYGVGEASERIKLESDFKKHSDEWTEILRLDLKIEPRGYSKLSPLFRE